MLDIIGAEPDMLSQNNHNHGQDENNAAVL